MTSWAEVESRLAYSIGGGETGSATARHFLVAAIDARWETTTLHDLTASERGYALQRAVVATSEILDIDGDLAFWRAGVRAHVASAFARAFGVAEVEGPPWRLDPSETDRPTHPELLEAADFT